MNNENPTGKTNALELKLRLPSGMRCRAMVLPENMGTEVVDRLIERGWLKPGQYEFVAHGNIHMTVHQPVGRLFWPGETSTSVEVRRLDASGRPEKPDDYKRMQLLYGCPTAVTEQADRLTDCMVTRTAL